MQTIATIETFLTTIHPCTNAQTDYALGHSIVSWLSCYLWMHTLRGWHQAPAAIDMRGHFATIAEVTLDGIADTFCCFFGLPWTRAETSHTRLTATFPPFCVAHRLAGDTDDVYIRMRDLQTRLSTARSVDRPCADSLHETLRDFFTALDQYIIVLFHFFESNLESPYPVTQQC